MANHHSTQKSTNLNLVVVSVGGEAEEEESGRKVTKYIRHRCFSLIKLLTTFNIFLSNVLLYCFKKSAAC